jgi:hypothetical protein
MINCLSFAPRNQKVIFYVQLLVVFPSENYPCDCLTVYFFFPCCTLPLPHDSVYAFANLGRLETITISTAGHATNTFVHCAGSLSRRCHNILVPRDASNILQIRDLDCPICAASTQVQFPKVLFVCIYTRRWEHLPWCHQHWKQTWFQFPDFLVPVAAAQLFIFYFFEGSAIYIHEQKFAYLPSFPVCLLRRICIFRMPVAPCIMNKIVAVINM